MINIYFFSLISLCSAQQEIFKARSQVELRKIEVRLADREFLVESCRLQKLQKTLQWACELPKAEMLKHCRVEVPKIKSIESLPKLRYLKGLPVECQVIIEARRRVLDYKANGT